MLWGSLKEHNNMTEELKSGPLKDVDDVLENADVLTSVEARMDNLRTILNEEDLADQSEELDESTLDDQADESDDSVDTTPEDEPEEDGGSKDKDETPEPDKPELPEAYIRCAIHQGWSADDVQEEFEANPERALRTLKNIYETTNRATRDFAQLGRAQAEATRKAAEKPEPEIKDFVNISELEKQVDDPAIVSGVIKPLNDALKSMTQELRALKKSGSSADNVAFARSDQEAAIARANAAAADNTLTQVNRFFAADNMNPYKDFYGDIKPGQDMNDITPRQKEHRMAVLQTADQLIVGKTSQGMRITTEEALESAHLLVTDSLREKIITDNIRSSLKKRSKGKTLRPSDSKKTVSNESVRAKNREEAIVNAERRLAKFNKDWS